MLLAGGGVDEHQIAVPPILLHVRPRDDDRHSLPIRRDLRIVEVGDTEPIRWLPPISMCSDRYRDNEQHDDDSFHQYLLGLSEWCAELYKVRAQDYRFPRRSEAPAFPLRIAEAIGTGNRIRYLGSTCSISERDAG